MSELFPFLQNFAKLIAKSTQFIQFSEFFMNNKNILVYI